MKLSGSYTFSAPREEVWELLQDPVTLQRIIPGCERLEETGPDTYAADIKLGLAGVKGDYSGTVRISDQHPPERYRLTGEGRGKPGFAKGEGTVELVAEPDGRTTMRYAADAQVGGPVAGIGQRLIEGAAKSIINQSLKALSAEIEARQASVENPKVVTETRSDEASDDSASEPAGGTSQPGGTTPSAPTQAPPAPPAPAAPVSTPRRESGSPATGLTTVDVMRGMADDLLAEQPALRWAVPLPAGLVLGILFGIRIGKGAG